MALSVAEALLRSVDDNVTAAQMRAYLSTVASEIAALPTAEAIMQLVTTLLDPDREDEDEAAES